MNPEPGDIKLHFLDYWRVIRVRFPLILLAFLIVVITTGVMTYYMPRQYESRVTIQVEEDDRNMTIFNNDSGVRLDPRFATTQFNIMQSTGILYPVIDSMNLIQKWGREYGLQTRQQAYYRLRSMLDVKEVRNTALLQLTVMSRDPKEAADLANAVAKEYQDRRIGEQQDRVDRSLAQLRDEVAKQQITMETLRDEAARIRKESGINDLNPDTSEDPMQASERTLVTVEEQVSEARLKNASLATKFAQISKMSDDQIMRSLRTLEIEDPTIQQVLPQYQEAVSDEARLLNSGLGPNHPTFRSLRAKREVYERQLADQIASLRKTFSSNVEMAEKNLAALENQLSLSRDSQQQSKTRSQSYVEAKSKYIQARKILEGAQMRLQTQTMEYRLPRTPAKIWDTAEPAEGPSRPRVFLNMVLGVVVGLVFGLGLAFFVEYLDTSVKTMEDVETFLGVPVLAVIPKNVALLINAPANHPDAEAYRILRTNVEFNRKSPDANTMTFVSGGAGEGKSTTLANLAYTFSQGGYTTLIVDGDLRRPTQHNIFEVDNEYGLSDFLTTDVPLDEVVVHTNYDNLYLLPSGKLPLDAVSALNSQRMVDLIAEVKNRFDMVLFDSPPILGVSDASVLASAVDLTVIVVQHRRFPRTMLQRVKQSINNVGGTILGVVLNNVDVRHDQHYEYYTSYYSYYTPGRTATKVGGKKRKAAPGVEPVQNGSKPAGAPTNDDNGDY